MSGFTHPEYLVETEWLAQNLNNPEVLVLDCTTHLIPDPKIIYQVKPGREDFEAGHIPGAQFVDMLRDVSDTSQSFAFHAPVAGRLRGRSASLRHEQHHARGHIQQRQRLVGDAVVVAAA